MPISKRLISFVCKQNRMARNKNYNEEEVIEKAMHLFWRNGYESTSTRMLEKEMGINQFSIYSSFKNKQGVYVESIKCYQNKLKAISNKLKASATPVEAIKDYFYDFIRFSCNHDEQVGCFVVNTISEIGENGDSTILSQAKLVGSEIKSLFTKNLELDKNKTEQMIKKQANYLIMSITGLATASKMFNEQQIEDYIEMTFQNL